MSFARTIHFIYIIDVMSSHSMEGDPVGILAEISIYDLTLA